MISITRICIRLKTLLTVHTVHLKNDGSKSESINCHHYRKGEQRATLPSCLLPLLLFEFRQFQSNSTTQRRRPLLKTSLMVHTVYSTNDGSKVSPSIVIITEKGNHERHFPPAFFPFFSSNFDNSRAIVQPSGGGIWCGGRRHGGAAQR